MRIRTIVFNSNYTEHPGFYRVYWNKRQSKEKRVQNILLENIVNAP